MAIRWNKQENALLNYYVKRFLLIDKCGSARTLRRSFTTYMLLKGANVKMVQKQMGLDINTTYSYFIFETEEYPNL